MKRENKARSDKSVNPIPEGFHSVTPYLVAENATSLLDFMKRAFNAELKFITKREDGKIMHATVMIGDSMIMVSDTMEDMRPEPAMLFLYVEDVDTIYRQALEARGISIQQPKDEFYGDRAAAVKDQFNNKWWIATHIENVSDEEMKRRSQEEIRRRADQHQTAHSN